VITPSLVEGELLRRLGVGERAMRVVNPVSDEDTLRTTLIPSLLQVAARNRNHGRTEVALCEVGRAYLRDPDEQSDRQPERQPQEPTRLAAVRTGLADADASRVAFLALKGALERAVDTLAPLDAIGLEYQQAQAPMFHPGRCARVVVDGHPLGHVGEMHPSVLQAVDLEVRAVALEVDLEPLLAVDGMRQARPLPRFPAVNRDLGVVVPLSVPAGELQATIKDAGGALLESVRAFDEYRGSQVPEGYKSVAFALTFRSPERTLTDSEVDAQLEMVRAELRRRHGAGFRG
jgi:phenylalanyl-tRNA synthetase beta chain